MNEREIFEAALELTDPLGRESYLDETCAGDPELRRRVEELLALHAADDGFLSIPAIPVVSPRAPADEGQPAPTSAAEFEKTQEYEQNPNGGDEVSLDFLEASEKPGSLGRLGHYEVHEVLGQGGFGIVLKAFDEKLHRIVAIKVLSPEVASTSPPRKRFLREARASAAIRHDSVVAVHSVEEHPLPYLVMDFIPGKTLQQLLNENGPLDVPDILRIGQQIAAGLAAAHAQGLIHRDIKPSNILLENGIAGRAKITDFGLARTTDDANATQSGTIAGTPMYMSPEQASNGAVDQRTDLFSLGSVLYVMTSGRPPFRAATMLAVLKRVVDDTPRPIPEIISDVPAWLCAIIAKLHAKRPEDRFATAQEVGDLLGRCQADLQANRPVELPADLLPVSPPATTRTPRQPLIVSKTDRKSADRRRRWPTIAVLAMVVLAGIGLTEFLGVTQIVSTVIGLTKRSDSEVVSEGTATADTLAGRDPMGRESDADDSDRRAAEWVLSMGGTVNHGQITAPLPDGPFRIESISLNNCKTVQVEGLKHLSGLQELEFLQLCGVLDITDAGVQSIKDVPNLHSLDISSTDLTAASLIHFAKIAPLRNVTCHAPCFTDQAVTALSSCPVEYVFLANPTESELARLSRLSKLKTLTLSLDNKRALGLNAWRSLANVANLESLAIINALETNENEEVLNVLSSLPRLTVLNFSDADSGDSFLLKLSQFQQLKQLELRRLRNVTRAGVDALAAALPSCKIDWDGTIIEPRATNASRDQQLSAWDTLDAGNIPAAERVPGQPPELVAVIGEHRQRHWSEPRAIAVRSDGKEFVTISQDSVRFWEANTWKQVGQGPGIQEVYGAAWIPGSDLIIVSHQGYVTIFDRKSFDGQLPPNPTTTRLPIGTGRQAIVHPCVSPDGKLFVGHHANGALEKSPQTIALVSLAGDTPQTLLEIINAECGAFSQDNQQLAFVRTDDRSLRVYDLTATPPKEDVVIESAETASDDKPTLGFFYASFLSDGRLLAADKHGKAWIWSLGKESAKLDYGFAMRYRTEWASPPMMTVAAGKPVFVIQTDQSSIEVWDLGPDAASKRVEGTLGLGLRGQNLTCLGLLPDGTSSITGHLNGSVRFCDVSGSSLKEIQPLNPLPVVPHTALVQQEELAVCGSELFFTDETDRLHSWKIVDSQLREQPINGLEPQPARLLAASSDGRRLIRAAYSNRPGAMLLQRDGAKLHPASLFGSHIYHYAVLSSSADLLLLSADDHVELWDVARRPPKLSKQWPTGPGKMFQHMQFAEEDRRVIAWSTDTVYTLDVTRDDSRPEAFMPHPVWGTDVFSDQRRMLGVLRDPARLTLWSFAGGAMTQTHEFPGGNFRGFKVSPDGNQLAASRNLSETEYLIELYDLATQQVVREIAMPGPAERIAWTDDGRHLVTSNVNGTIYVLRLQSRTGGTEAK